MITGNKNTLKFPPINIFDLETMSKWSIWNLQAEKIYYIPIKFCGGSGMEKNDLKEKEEHCKISGC